jgi:hypothetical protein
MATQTANLLDLAIELREEYEREAARLRAEYTRVTEEHSRKLHELQRLIEDERLAGGFTEGEHGRDSEHGSEDRGSR